MKTLYLLRHAKSSWKNPQLKDVNRPLSGRGKNDAPLMGKLLKKMGEKPEIIISSPAKRAMATAKRIAMEIGIKKKSVVTDERLYMAGREDFIKVIGETEKSVERLMLVSHNFGVTDFANFITESDIVNIPTCGVVRVDLDMTKWKDIASTKGKLIFFISPKRYAD